MQSKKQIKKKSEDILESRLGTEETTRMQKGRLLECRFEASTKKAERKAEG